MKTTSLRIKDEEVVKEIDQIKNKQLMGPKVSLNTILNELIQAGLKVFKRKNK